jgi:hypothetical protein
LEKLLFEKTIFKIMPEIQYSGKKLSQKYPTPYWKVTSTENALWKIYSAEISPSENSSREKSPLPLERYS